MTSLAELVRLTAPDSAVWRECAACGALAAYAPDETRCGECRTADGEEEL